MGRYIADFRSVGNMQFEGILELDGKIIEFITSIEPKGLKNPEEYDFVESVDILSPLDRLGHRSEADVEDIITEEVRDYIQSGKVDFRDDEDWYRV